MCENRGKNAKIHGKCVKSRQKRTKMRRKCVKNNFATFRREKNITIWVEQRVPPGILCFEFLTAKMRDAHGTCIHWGKLEKQIFRMV